ncbi:MAG: NAD(P)-binding domain-containing protein [Promethearchaeota archaeon]
MIEKVGIIGVGHLASYLVEGLKKASKDIKIILSPRNREISSKLATQFGVKVAKNNESVVNSSDIVILTTRPDDTIKVAKNLKFRTNQTVISVAIGLSLKKLESVTIPAKVIRALPISCAAINQSPTLLFPDNVYAREIFSLLGTVHILQNESEFTHASVIGAFYAWMFVLLNETISWVALKGVPQSIARNLVLETVRGTVNMALNEPNKDLDVILDTLATPGGITEYGLTVLLRQKGISAWIDAFDAVYNYLKKK